jgi:hypothetical protein
MAAPTSTTPTVTVIYTPEGAGTTAAPTGTRWTVPAEGARPNHAARKRAALHGVEVVEDYTTCAACGVVVATVVGLDYLGHAVAAFESDRTVNDHADFTVVDADGRPARVGYSPATVVVTCPACNGSGRREFVRDELAAAAVARLDRFAGRD